MPWLIHCFRWHILRIYIHHSAHVDYSHSCVFLEPFMSASVRVRHLSFACERVQWTWNVCYIHGKRRARAFRVFSVWGCFFVVASCCCSRTSYASQLCFVWWRKNATGRVINNINTLISDQQKIYQQHTRNGFRKCWELLLSACDPVRITSCLFGSHRWNTWGWKQKTDKKKRAHSKHRKRTIKAVAGG